MNEEVETTEQAETPVEQAAPDGELSLSEHEQQFAAGEKRTAFVPDDGTVGKEREVGEQPSDEPSAEESARKEAAAQQARDKETGQFKQGRRRAKSQQASAEDVPRIKELTRQLRERDEELARLRTPPQPPAVTHAPPSGNGHHPAAAQAQPKPGERYTLPAPPFDPEPQENDPKYGGDAFAYMRDVSRWESRQAIRQSEFDRMVEANERQQRETQQAELKGFAERVEAAKSRHDDFEDVAFHTETPIQKDSIVDIFVLRDDNGPEMLYYLHSHPKELGELLKMPELDQVKRLTLLSQRLSPNGHGSTGAVTTSVPGTRTIVLPPKPPNVVRTEAQRASAGPPTDRELSLSEHENYYRPKTRR